MAERKEELKSLLMKLKEESEKYGLKVNNQETKITAFGTLTSWQIDGGKSGSSDSKSRGSKAGAPKSLCMVTAATKLKDGSSLEGKP